MAKNRVGTHTDVTIIVDSGCFLPKKSKEETLCEIGYFQCKPSEPDITVKADGREILKDPNLINLGDRNCLVEIQHRNADGTTRKGGITIPVPFHEELLHLEELYGKPVRVNRKNFDCILHFESGEFGVADVRERKFNKFNKLGSGKLSARPEDTKYLKPIAHDIVVRFKLADGESIALTRNGEQFWSSNQLDVKKDLEIKINADDSTPVKFYRDSLKAARGSYWLPNPDDPPPVCSFPPCPDGA